MKLVPRPGSRVALLLTFVLAVLGWGGGSARGNPVSVIVLAPRSSRLADDLVRELKASGFVVIVAVMSNADWHADVSGFPATHPSHGVTVQGGDRLMTVFTRRAPTSPIEERFGLAVDPEDRMARRRACLSVVEYLRALSESDSASGLDSEVRSKGIAQPDSVATGSSARTPVMPIRPTPTSAPPPIGRASPAGVPLALASPVAAPVAGGGTSSASASAASGSGPEPEARRAMSSPGRRPSAPGERPLVPPGQSSSPAPPAPVSSPSAVASGSAVAESADPVEAREAAQEALEAASREGPASRHRLWQLGVGSTLNLEAAPGGPTGHLQFLWYLPLEWRLALCLRALWPVLGAQFRTEGSDVRVWNFGGAVSLQYLFETGGTRLQPFVGAAVGARVALTESTPANALQSRETFTPSLNLGADAGVRYSLSPLVQLFFEAGVLHGWLVPGINRTDYEEDAANSDSFHTSFGVLFEI